MRIKFEFQFSFPFQKIQLSAELSAVKFQINVIQSTVTTWYFK